MPRSTITSGKPLPRTRSRSPRPSSRVCISNQKKRGSCPRFFVYLRQLHLKI
jgi:hypothetical protein